VQQGEVVALGVFVSLGQFAQPAEFLIQRRGEVLVLWVKGLNARRSDQIEHRVFAGAELGVGNMETWGNAMWGTTFAESIDSPWEPMNVVEGFDASESTLFMIFSPKLISVCGGDMMTIKALRDQMVARPESIVYSLKHAGDDRGAVVMFTPAGAKAFSKRYGFSSAQQLQDYLWDNVTRTRGDWESDYFFYSTGGIAKKNPRGSRMLNPDYLDLTDDALVPRFMSPNNIKITVAGEGEWPGWGWVGFMTYFVTSIDKWR